MFVEHQFGYIALVSMSYSTDLSVDNTKNLIDERALRRT